MSNTPEPSDDTLAAVISQNIGLQARIDALNAMVEVLASRSGVNLQVFRATSEKIRAASYQKRLERIEDQSPEASAKIDQREDMPSIDPDLMNDLRSGGDLDMP